ncbi:MAG: DNA gyrase subunit A [Candidatus Methanomethylophilus sp.]|nr:DNA gyrase subunit A [Methanomethylophilus sp.]
MDAEERILVQTVEKEMQRSYIDYSMSVIVSRALPDVRDGLKPVHRKIMFAMHELGLAFNRPHKKSATVVGEVLGKYHPHGDTAAYDAMVRMGQPFSLRYPLVDGQGNFGSVDGDPPAAMRYTEARLSKMASDLLLDLDKDTVDFVDNFDGSLKEPSVLPSKFPNLLVNGSDGIAVGMATKMPPHNLTEVCNAIIYTIDNPDVEVAQLMEFVPGPDFPTGGIINGAQGITEAYTTGRGRIKIRSKTHFEELKSGKTSIIVDEIPYQVNKAELVKSIAELVKDKAITGITDLRDESDRKGMRIVIELHKDAIADVVLENLMKKTQMENTYGIINLALVNNKPTLLGLKDLITHYINHRRSVVTRRVRFDLNEAEKRFHILDGLIKALNMLDKTIALIRASKTGAEANEGLQNLLGIDQVQAQAILDMRLQKLTGLEITTIRDEYDALIIKMNDLKDILAKPERVDAIIKDELKQMKDTYGDERRTEINRIALDVDAEDLIPKEEMVYTLSDDNYIKRIPLRTYRQQARGGVGLTGMQTKESDFMKNMLVASSHTYLLFITDTGRILWLKGYNIPEGSRQSKGKPIVNMLPDLQPGENITNIIPANEFPADKYLVFCTKNGLLKKTSLDQYGNVRNKGIKAIKLDDGDALMETWITDGSDEIILATNSGLACRFSEEDVRPTGRDTMGVKGMTIGLHDEVVSMAVVKPTDLLLTVTENGFGKISTVDDYRKTHRGGKGVITIKTTKKNGGVVSVRRVCDNDELMVISKSGKIIRIKVDSIRKTGRNAQGVKIMELKDDDVVVSLMPILNTDGQEEETETTQ